MWDGYAFAIDFREERGHAYMLSDQSFTERQRVTNQPGSCVNCHASVYTVYKKLGDGDIFKGFNELNKIGYGEARKQVNHPVACIDCHDSQTMALRVTRPAFMTGIQALKASQGVQNYDVNRDATRQEMRTYVCGQCHVEYYFKGPEKTLTYRGRMHEGKHHCLLRRGPAKDGRTTRPRRTCSRPRSEFEMYNRALRQGGIVRRLPYAVHSQGL